MSTFVRPNASTLMHDNYMISPGASSTTDATSDIIRSSFPVSNCNRPERWKKWRLKNPNGVSAVFDLGSAKRPSSMALIDTNDDESLVFNSVNGRWLLYASNDPTFSTYSDLSFWSFSIGRKEGVALYLGSDKQSGVWYYHQEGDTASIVYPMITSDDGILLLLKKTSSDIESAKLTSGGELDTNYGTSGYLTTTHTGNPSEFFAIKSSDGDMVIAGRLSSDMSVSLMDEDGAMVTSFDTDGVAVSDFNSETDTARCVVEQSTGHFVAIGAAIYSSVTRVGAVRFDTSGSQTHQFNTLLTGSTAGENDSPNGCAVDSNDNVYIVGSTEVGGSDNSFVVKTNSTLSIDTGFNSTGILEFSQTSNNYSYSSQTARTCVVDSSDNVIVISSCAVTGDEFSRRFMGVAKIDGTGAFVTDFLGSGKYIYDNLDGVDYCSPHVAVIDSADSVYAACSTYIGGVEFVSVIKILSNGKLDTTFGSNGISSVSVGSVPDATSIQLDGFGRILVSGSALARSDSATSGFVFRLTSGGVLDTSFSPSSENDPKRYWKLSVQDKATGIDQWIGYIHLGSYLDIRPEPGAGIELNASGDTFVTYENDMVTDYMYTLREFSFSTKDMTREEVCGLRDAIEQRGAHTPFVVDAYARRGDTIDREYGLFYGYMTKSGFFEVTRSSAFGEDIKIKIEESL